jgi:gentisate 1,2-dioxygenase
MLTQCCEAEESMPETESTPDLPPRLETGSTQASAYAARGRYLAPVNAFREKLPPVPAVTFTAERDRAFDPDAPTGSIALDISGRLASPVPATTPLLLARYVRVRAGETLRMHLRATALICYVIQGAGETVQQTDRLAWSQGDIFRMPGGSEIFHRADRDSVLWTVSNEPEVAFHRLEPPTTDSESLAVAYFPAAEIRRHLDEVRVRPNQSGASGKVVVFATAEFEKLLSLTPSMTLALNSMEPGQAQNAHRHNSTAVTLVIEGEHCYSTIDGVRMDWQRHATMITPATAVHSHHNDSGQLATFLIVQDGGLFYHCRTIGFSFV